MSVLRYMRRSCPIHLHFEVIEARCMRLNSPSLYEDLYHQATQMSWGSCLRVVQGKNLILESFFVPPQFHKNLTLGQLWKVSSLSWGPCGITLWVLILLVCDKRKGDDPRWFQEGSLDFTSRVLTVNTFPCWKCTGVLLLPPIATVAGCDRSS